MKKFGKYFDLKKNKKSFFSKKVFAVLVVFLIVLAIILRQTVFSREKIGTREHRTKAPYCESDDECLLYNCTNCGNKYWIKKNESTDCDKEKSLIIGCQCVEGKCKRVLRKNE